MNKQMLDMNKQMLNVNKQMLNANKQMLNMNKQMLNMNKQMLNVNKQMVNVNEYMVNIIHLLDRTETNIIFIWSGKVILGKAKPSPNITIPDQINMILGEVLSNKCFYYSRPHCVHPVHRTFY